MKKKKKGKNIKGNQTGTREELAQGKFLRQCGKALLITASYQIFSVGMSVDAPQGPPGEQGGKCLLGTIPTRISSAVLTPAYGQIKGQCVAGCIGCTSVGSSGGSGGGYSPPAYDPVAEQRNRAHNLNEEGVRYNSSGNYAKGLECFREALRLWPEDTVIQNNLRKTEQTLLNLEGIKYYNNKDWEKAADYFRRALEKWPDNETVKGNLQQAESALRQERAEKERERQEKQTAADMRASLNSMGSLFSSPAPQSSGLEFEKKSASPSGGLEFMTGPPTPQPATVGADLQDKGSLLKGKAVQEAATNLENTKQGRSGIVFDTAGQKGSAPPVVVPGTDQPIQMSERARKDPRMMAAQKQMEDLQTTHRKLDEQRKKLVTERNTATDPAKMRELSKELDKVEKDYQANLLAVSNQSQKIEKLKRTIDTEVETPAEPTGKGGAK